MTVRKFRSLEEMKEERWREPGDPELYRAIRAIWEFGSRTGIHRFPPGVYKYRSFEDMQRQTESWQKANFEAIQEARRQTSNDVAPPNEDVEPWTKT
jgi:hypothetical protein